MLGMICFLKEDYKMALQYYNDSVEDNSENYNAHFEIGKTYCYLKHWQDAVKKFDFILEHAPRTFDLVTVRTSRNFAYIVI